MDTFLTQVSESKLLGVPGLQPLRRELLQSALSYYEDFAKQRGDDPAMRGELASSYYRSGLIKDKLGETRAAAEALEKAASLQETIVSESGSGPGPSPRTSGHAWIWPTRSMPWAI